MYKIIHATLKLLLLGTIFMSGLAGGVYYNNELLTVWRSLFTKSTVEEVAPATSSQEPVSGQSQITLPGLDQPLPLVYSDTLDEAVIQEYLKEGAVMLPLGTSFGDSGNVVITAHSSGTQAFGPHRFAFARLSELEEGQQYTITTPTATYTYRVYSKEVVWPHEVDHLPSDDRSTVTLVTCWPLWTNFKRLLVHTELVTIDYHV